MWVVTLCRHEGLGVLVPAADDDLPHPLLTPLREHVIADEDVHDQLDAWCLAVSAAAARN